MDSAGCGCCGRSLFDQPLIRLDLVNDHAGSSFHSSLHLLVDFPFAASLPLQPECMIGQTISHYRVSEKVSGGLKVYGYD